MQKTQEVVQMCSFLLQICVCEFALHFFTNELRNAWPIDPGQPRSAWTMAFHTILKITPPSDPSSREEGLMVIALLPEGQETVLPLLEMHFCALPFLLCHNGV